MTPGLDKDIQCHEHLYLCPGVAKHQIKPKAFTEWTVSLMIADSHFNLPQDFVCVYLRAIAML